MSSEVLKQLPTQLSWVSLAPPGIASPFTLHELPTHLHMLDFRELELLGDEGGVWYDQL